MGNQNSVKSMIKKLELEKVDKNRALAYEKKLKQKPMRSWSERVICKRSSGIDMKNFDIFLEKFKKNNDLEEYQVNYLRDLRFSSIIEVKVKSYCFDCEGSMWYGMIAATKSSAGIIDFIIALYVIQFTDNNVQKMKDIEDYIKMKALTAFQEHGYIKAVSYE